MPILTFKPYTLQILKQEKGYEDENGDFHKGKEEWADMCRCNIVPSGRANVIKLPDGSSYQYSYTVTLPTNIRDLIYGERVRILFEVNKKPTDVFVAECDGEYVALCIPKGNRVDVLGGVDHPSKEFTVKGFHRYQHHCKLWI